VRRYSTTTEYDTLYAAIPVAHPSVGFVRLALPLTEIAEQQHTVFWLSLAGVATSLPVAALLAWGLSAAMAGRVSAPAAATRRPARRRRVPGRAGPVAHLHRESRAGRRAGRRRHSRAARHQRPSSGRSGPPRFRRQRVARAAHAVDGHQGLRGGAARGSSV